MIKGKEIISLDCYVQLKNLIKDCILKANPYKSCQDGSYELMLTCHTLYPQLNEIMDKLDVQALEEKLFEEEKTSKINHIAYVEKKIGEVVENIDRLANAMKIQENWDARFNHKKERTNAKYMEFQAKLNDLQYDLETSKVELNDFLNQNK